MALDMCRGALGIVALDTEESFSYGFESADFSGVSAIADIAWEYLATVSRIPKRILVGGYIRKNDVAVLEPWYNFVDGIRETMLKANLRHLLQIILQAAVNRRELDELPPLNVEFLPLWSLDALEQAEAEHKQAEAQLHRANAARSYFDMGALASPEIKAWLDKRQ